ncbi:MAG: type II toxin-antitoxin system Phd/YefM family antitoxin [Oscillospiraceae bacterium]|nr:type II toxin-antitoxin system Phd/YefM family antitoxin [Oscillospiraceae bacterium]
MPNTANFLHSLVPITQFNKGQAARIFDRVKSESQLVVLKNNVPSAIILSPDEYERLTEIEENYNLLSLAESRLKNGWTARSVDAAEAMHRLGITPEDIENAEDVEIE